MALHAFLSGANAVCFEKDHRKYAMICAWATMIDYDTIGLLIGEQSVTGHSIELGMIIGVSALSKEQKTIALRLGNGHSDNIDKLDKIKYHQSDTAILINGARNNLVCRVDNILTINSTCADRFVVARITEVEEDVTKSFLDVEEVFHK